MDEMKLNLGSRFMRKMVSKLISKYLSKQIGSKVTLDFNALNVSFDDGDTIIKTDLELRMLIESTVGCFKKENQYK